MSPSTRRETIFGVAVVALGKVDQRRNQQRLVLHQAEHGISLSPCMRRSGSLKRATAPHPRGSYSTAAMALHESACSVDRRDNRACTFAPDRRLPPDPGLRWPQQLSPTWARPSITAAAHAAARTLLGGPAAQRWRSELGLAATGWQTSDERCRPWPATSRLPARGHWPRVYSGHQFGNWAGQLGDGRAILLGETARRAMELQLKGAGLTPYSRMGDGRAVLRCSHPRIPVQRGHARAGHAHHARAVRHRLGRSRCGAKTMETAAVVTRVAPSFMRFGHFEHFCAPATSTTQLRAPGRLRHRPLLPRLPRDTGRRQPLRRPAGSGERAHRAHGGAVAGGGLLPRRDEHRQHEHPGPDHRLRPFPVSGRLRPGHICNHSDHQGRYAFDRQPHVAYWNLYCLGQALLPLMDDQELALAALEPTRRVFPQRLAAPHAAPSWAWSRCASLAPQDLLDGILRLLAAERGGLHHLLAPPVARRAARNSRPSTGARPVPGPRAFDAWLRLTRRCCSAMRPAWLLRRMLATNPQIRAAQPPGRRWPSAQRSKETYTVVQRLA